MKLAHRLAQAWLARQVEPRMRKMAQVYASAIKKPRPSQLGQLREVLHYALEVGPASGRQAIRTYLEGLPSNARKQLERDVIDGMPLRSWLLTQVDRTDLFLPEPPPPFRLGAFEMTLSPADVYRWNLRCLVTTTSLAARKIRAAEAAPPEAAEA